MSGQKAAASGEVFFTYGVDSCLSSLRHHCSFFSIAQNAYCYPVLATFHVITALGSVLFVYSSYHVSPPSKLDNSCACFTDNSVSCSSNVTPNGCRDIAKNDNKSSELCQNSIIAVEQTNTIGYIIDASNIKLVSITGVKLFEVIQNAWIDTRLSEILWLGLRAHNS